MPSTITNLPEIQSGRNTTTVRIGAITVWFSYSTAIAFESSHTGLVVRENDWGPTTGKHLNAIDGGTSAAKAARVSRETFEQKFALALS